MGTTITEIRKALTTVSDGAALAAEVIDQVLHEELLKKQPLAELLSIIPSEGKYHTYKMRTTHPMAWFEGELTPANQTNSVYAEKSLPLKIQRIWGGVSGYADATSEPFIEALSEELVGSVEGMSNVLEYGILHGCASDTITTYTGDSYQYTGILPRTYQDAATNVIDAGSNKVTLDDLDAAIAKVKAYRGVDQDPLLWMMGSDIKLVCDGLQTRVSLPLQSLEMFDGKMVMGSYGGIPIFETDYLAGDTTISSPTVSASAVAGGALTATTQYFYAISSVGVTGEKQVGVEANATTGLVNKSVTITWAHDDNALLYMVWRGTTTGVLKLLDIIPAKTYDSSGTVTGYLETYTDAGAKSTNTVKPLQSGEKVIALVNRNPRRGISFVGNIDSMGQRISTLFSYVPLARVRDSYDYMLKGYLAARLVQPSLVSVIRHAKLS